MIYITVRFYSKNNLRGVNIFDNQKEIIHVYSKPDDILVVTFMKEVIKDEKLLNADCHQIVDISMEEPANVTNGF